MPFQKGHKDFRTEEGKKRSSDYLRNMPKDLRRYNTADNHHNWKGDEVGYVSLHKWVRLRIPEPELCPDCFTNTKLDLANLTGVYDRDLTNWGYKCRKCHKRYDNLKAGIVQGSKKTCVNGHEYNIETRAFRKNGDIYCKVCNRTRANKYRKLKYELQS